MTQLRSILSRHDALPRVVPLLVFIVLTALQGKVGEDSQYWIYLAKTLVGIWMILVVRPMVPEMKWAFSWQAVVAGVAVFAMWVGLDGLYPRLNELFSSKDSAPSVPQWTPFADFGEGAPLAWFHIVVRILGSTLLVPLLEEVFYRSFLYRWIVKPDFQLVEFRHFSPKAFIITAAVFGFAHGEWLAGIFCAMIYQALVIRQNRLGDAILAHAVTNLLLGCWVVYKGAWHFW